MTHQDTISVRRTLGDTSLPDLLMGTGVGSATGAPWSRAIFASGSTHAPRAACLSVPYNSSCNFMLRPVCYWTSSRLLLFLILVAEPRSLSQGYFLKVDPKVSVTFLLGTFLLAGLYCICQVRSTRHTGVRIYCCNMIWHVHITVRSAGTAAAAYSINRVQGATAPVVYRRAQPFPQHRTH